MSTVAAWLLVVAYGSFLLATGRAGWRRVARWLGAWGALLGLVPVLLALGFRDLAGLARYALFLALPALVVSRTSPWASFLAGWLIWMSIEPDLFGLLFPWTGPVWRAVALSAAGLPLLPGGSLHLPLAKMVALWLALYLFVAWKPLPRPGLSSALSRRMVAVALVGWLAFALAGLPLGLTLKILRWAPQVPSPGTVLLALVGGYFLVALPEEVLFRGVFQQVLEERLGSRLGLALTALIFGLAHLNNGTPGHPVPNAAYALMATLAGVAYGEVWHRTGRVTASALTHVLVNLVWGLLFGG